MDAPIAPLKGMDFERGLNGTVLQILHRRLGHGLRDRAGDRLAQPRPVRHHHPRVPTVPVRTVETRHLRGGDRGANRGRALHRRPDLGLLRRRLHVGADLPGCALGDRGVVSHREAQTPLAATVRGAVPVDVLGQLVLRSLPAAARREVHRTLADQHPDLIDPVHLGRIALEPGLAQGPRCDVRLHGKEMAGRLDGVQTYHLVCAAVHVDRGSGGTVFSCVIADRWHVRVELHAPFSRNIFNSRFSAQNGRSRRPRDQILANNVI